MLFSNVPFHSLLSKFNSQKCVPIVSDCDVYCLTISLFPFTVQMINHENDDLATDFIGLFYKKHLHTINSSLFLIFLAIAKPLVQVKLFCLCCL